MASAVVSTGSGCPLGAGFRLIIAHADRLRQDPSFIHYQDYMVMLQTVNRYGSAMG